jgi:hypothetical protein
MKMGLMPVRDWPKPVRRAIGWGLVALSLLIAIGPILFLLSVMRSEEALLPLWVRILGGYSLFVTVPTTVVTVGVLVWNLTIETRRPLAFSIVFGTVLGLLVGTVLTIVTAGYSLLSAPAVGLLTALAVHDLRRRQDR